MGSDLRRRLSGLRDELFDGLVERDEPARLVLLAALAGEHLLLVGPPGTAKSELARRLHHGFEEGRYFERLLTRFSVPEELFGPISIKALEQDRYERRIEGWLPTASIAFLDEIFKANSAILNSLLTLLNEREFDNDSRRIKTPLVCVIAASNELAEGEDYAALSDRFLLRYRVNPVTPEAFPRLLDLKERPAPRPRKSLRLSFEELERLRQDARRVRVPADVKALLAELRTFLAGQKVYVSDRRWRKIIGLLQVSACTNGQDAVSIWDCWLLQHCTWEKPEQREAIFAWYQERQGVRESLDQARFERVVATWEKKLKEDQASQTHARDSEGRKLYRTKGGGSTTEPEYQKKDASGRLFFRSPNGDGEVTDYDLRHRYYDYGGIDNDAYISDSANRIMVERPAAMQPTRYSEDHVEGRLRQTKKEMESVERYLSGLESELKDLRQSIDAHLWIAPGFSGPAVQMLSQTRDAAEKLRQRLAAVEEGFRALPREEVVQA